MNTRNRVYPNDRFVKMPSEKFEAKAAGQKGSEELFTQHRERFWPTTQASGFAARRNRAGYLDRLLIATNIQAPRIPQPQDTVEKNTRSLSIMLM